MFKLFFLIFLATSALCSVIPEPDVVESTPIVTIKQGKVVGNVIKLDNREVNYFQHIRFGRAERFALPTPAESWDGVYEATKKRFDCPQINFFHPQSEDCLFLNVWSPKEALSDGVLRPVMVWIYGGGFTFGSIDDFPYKGGYISTIGDVIFVDMNYRVGPLGFYYTGTDEAPGNQGIFDQLLALKWVKENIKSFGGDPDSITLFGESAGAFSTSALILSPLAVGLFQRAILQSGAVVNAPQITPDMLLHETREHAMQVGCKQEDPHELLECVKKVPLAKMIIKEQPLNLPKLFAAQELSLMWGDKGGLLPKSPFELLKDGNISKVDIMFGNTRDEYSMILPMADPELLNPIELYTHEHAAENIRTLGHKLLFPDLEEVIKYYIKDLSLYASTTDVREVLMRFVSEYPQICPTYVFGKMYSDVVKGNHSSYSFRFDKRVGLLEVVGCVSWAGVCHASDIFYSFGMPLHPGILVGTFDGHSAKISRDMITAWTNFAKTGNPEKMGSIEWPQAFKQDGAVKTMAIFDEHEVVENYYEQRCEFWIDYFKKNN